jgi:hypothetical protein
MLKKYKIFALIPLVLLLTSCIRYEGNLSISNQGLVNGNILYAIDKSILTSSGINSLEDLKANQSTTNQTDVCSSPKYSENSTEYIIACSFSNANLKDSDLSAQVVGNQLEFNFKNQSDTDESDSSVTGEFGKVSVYVNFPGDIISISENRTGSVRKQSSKKVLISAPGSVKLDIKIVTALNSASSGLPSKPAISLDISSVIQLETQVKSVETQVLSLLNSKNVYFNKARSECYLPFVKTKGMGPSSAKALTASASQSAAISSYIKTAQIYLANYETCKIAMSKLGFNGVFTSTPNQTPTPVSPNGTSAVNDEIIAGEEVDSFSISAQYLSNKNTKVTVDATANTAYTVVASKSGVSKKINFKITTDSAGKKVFQTTSQIRGYKLALFMGNSELATTTVK